MLQTQSPVFEPFKVGKYTAQAELGRGSLGRVFSGVENTTAKQVAIKMLRKRFHQDENIVDLFFQQAERLKDFHHQNISPVLSYGMSAHGPYMIMPLIHGELLSKRISEQKNIDILEILDIILQISKGLAYLHIKNYVHGDLKPENIMIINQDHRTQVVLIDPALTDGKDGRIHGTPPYLSPEQLRSQSSQPVSDLYALGAILYEMTTHHKLFQGDLNQIVHQTLNQFPIAPSEFTEFTYHKSLENLILNLLAKRSTERIQSAEYLVKTIEKMIALYQMDVLDEQALYLLIPKAITSNLTPHQSPVILKKSILDMGSSSISGSFGSGSHKQDQSSISSSNGSSKTQFSSFETHAHHAYKIQDAREFPQRNLEAKEEAMPQASITSNTDEMPLRTNQMTPIASIPQISHALSEASTLIPMVVDQKLENHLSMEETKNAELEEIGKASTLPMFNEISFVDTHELDQKYSSPIPSQQHLSPPPVEALSVTITPEEKENQEILSPIPIVINLNSNNISSPSHATKIESPSISLTQAKKIPISVQISNPKKTNPKKYIPLLIKLSLFLIGLAIAFLLKYVL